MPGKRYKIGVKVLPGEPLTGAGRVCIHLFIPDPKGPFVEPSVLNVITENNRPKLVTKPTRGRLACDKKRVRIVTPIEKNRITHITHRTGDPRAVTCPKCISTTEYEQLMSKVRR